MEWGVPDRVIDHCKFSSVVDENQLPLIVFRYDRCFVYYCCIFCSILLTQHYIPHSGFRLMVRSSNSSPPDLENMYYQFLDLA